MASREVAELPPTEKEVSSHGQAEDEDDEAVEVVERWEC